MKWCPYQAPCGVYMSCDSCPDRTYRYCPVVIWKGAFRCPDCTDKDEIHRLKECDLEGTHQITCDLCQKVAEEEAANAKGK